MHGNYARNESKTTQFLRGEFKHSFEKIWVNLVPYDYRNGTPEERTQTPALLGKGTKSHDGMILVYLMAYHKDGSKNPYPFKVPVHAITPRLEDDEDDEIRRQFAEFSESPLRQREQAQENKLRQEQEGKANLIGKAARKEKAKTATQEHIERTRRIGDLIRERQEEEFRKRGLDPAKHLPPRPKYSFED